MDTAMVTAAGTAIAVITTDGIAAGATGGTITDAVGELRLTTEA